MCFRAAGFGREKTKKTEQMKDWKCRDAQIPSSYKRRKVLSATYVSAIDLKHRESKPYCGDTFHWY